MMAVYQLQQVGGV